MNKNTTNLKTNAAWVIYFVGFDDGQIEPFVGFERIETAAAADAETCQQEAQMAALVRGGNLLAVVDEDDREKAETLAHAFEKEILRLR